MNDSLPAGATFRASSASESHWLQPVLVLTVRWWPAPVSVGALCVNKNFTLKDQSKSWLV